MPAVCPELAEAPTKERIAKGANTAKRFDRLSPPVRPSRDEPKRVSDRTIRVARAVPEIHRT
jgi:hypothetical protein